jgi:hypothetical protein
VWPLAPGAVAPPSARALVHAARMHPHEVADAMIDALLAPAREMPDGSAPAPAAMATPTPELRGAAAVLLARWASVHNLGVHWCAERPAERTADRPADGSVEGRAALVMLRFDGLAPWLAAAAAAGLDPAAAQACAWRWLDLLLGRYAALQAPGDRLMLVSDGPAGGAGARLWMLADPTLPMPGASSGSAWGTAPGRPLPAVSWLHRVLPLLGIDAPAQGEGEGEGAARDGHVRAVDMEAAATAATDWLRRQGVTIPDLAVLRERAAAVRAITLARWRPGP